MSAPWPVPDVTIPATRELHSALVVALPWMEYAVRESHNDFQVRDALRELRTLHASVSAAIITAMDKQRCPECGQPKVSRG